MKKAILCAMSECWLILLLGLCQTSGWTLAAFKAEPTQRFTWYKPLQKQ